MRPEVRQTPLGEPALRVDAPEMQSPCWDWQAPQRRQLPAWECRMALPGRACRCLHRRLSHEAVVEAWC